MTILKYISQSFVCVVVLLFLQSCATTQQEWLRAESEDTIDGYARFVARHADSSHAGDAKTRIEYHRRTTDAFASACSSNTIRAYSDFLRKNGQDWVVHIHQGLDIKEGCYGYKYCWMAVKRIIDCLKQQYPDFPRMSKINALELVDALTNREPYLVALGPESPVAIDPMSGAGSIVVRYVEIAGNTAATWGQTTLSGISSSHGNKDQGVIDIIVPPYGSGEHKFWWSVTSGHISGVKIDYGYFVKYRSDGRYFNDDNFPIGPRQRYASIFYHW